MTRSPQAVLQSVHVPELKKELTAPPNTKWYNQNIRKAKVIRRRLERKKNKTSLQSDIDAFRAQAKFVNFLICEAKTEFNKTEVLKSKDDIKQLYQTCKRILNWNPDAEYPSNSPTHFFYDKNMKINDSISATLLKETI